MFGRQKSKKKLNLNFEHLDYRIWSVSAMQYITCDIWVDYKKPNDLLIFLHFFIFISQFGSLHTFDIAFDRNIIFDFGTNWCVLMRISIQILSNYRITNTRISTLSQLHFQLFNLFHHKFQYTKSFNNFQIIFTVFDICCCCYWWNPNTLLTNIHKVQR